MTSGNDIDVQRLAEMVRTNMQRMNDNNTSYDEIAERNVQRNTMLTPVYKKINEYMDDCQTNRSTSRTIDDIFHCHRHHISSIDGDGLFAITSCFIISPAYKNFHHPDNPNTNQPSFITRVLIRAHDNIRQMPFLMSYQTSKQETLDHFQQHLEQQRNQTGFDSRPASYTLCTTLVTAALVRMKKANKVLIGKDQKTIVCLYDSTSSTSTSTDIPTLPTPAPAPSIDLLWLTLNRPEYMMWTFADDMMKFHQQTQLATGTAGTNVPLPNLVRLNEETFPKALQYVAKDQYRRDRMYAMLKHQALWHMLAGESEVASWLLCELQAMKQQQQHHHTRNNDNKIVEDGDNDNDNDNDATVDATAADAVVAMKQNIIFQLLINKSFDTGLPIHESDVGRAQQGLARMGDYGYAVAHFTRVNNDLFQRDAIPPNIIVTASISRSDTNINGVIVENNSSLNDHNNTTNNNNKSITELSKLLRRKRNGGCAICGTTRFKADEGKLKECVRCSSVVYCSRVHQ